MLPVTPAGQRGSPARPARTGAVGRPSLASAVRAHTRPAVNSARRRGSAVRTSASSAGKSPGPGSGSGPRDSATAAAAGRRSAITAGCPLALSIAGRLLRGLLRAQRHPDRVRLGRARVAPGMRLVAAEVQRAPGPHLEQLPGYGELEQAVGDVDELLAGMLHGLAPAGRAGGHGCPRPG